MNNGEVPEKVTGLPAKQDYAGESPALSSIQERLVALAKKGWSIEFGFDWFETWKVSGYAGDTNCPYVKDYDPRDGHGFSYVSSDDAEPFVSFESFLAAVDWIETKINSIVPGSGKPPVVRQAMPTPQPRKSWWARFAKKIEGK